VEDVPVIVMDVRERPDEGVQHEDQPRENDHERDDKPEVHHEPPFLQLAVRSPFGRLESSGDSSFVLRKNRRLELQADALLVRVRNGDTFRWPPERSAKGHAALLSSGAGTAAYRVHLDAARQRTEEHESLVLETNVAGLIRLLPYLRLRASGPMAPTAIYLGTPLEVSE
jgi:hypothetical protein